MTEDTAKCPVCGENVPVNPGFLTWCECGWNLKPRQTPVEKMTLSDRLWLQLEEKRGESIFKGVLLQPGQATTSTRTLLWFFAMGFKSVTIFLWAAGIGLLFLSPGDPVFIFLAVFVLYFAYVSRTRYRTEPESALRREEFPALFQLVDDVSFSLGVSPPSIIAISHVFNAWVFQTGPSGKKVLVLGLPFFYMLKGQEKVALVAHEMSHFANGDPRRSLQASFVIQTLAEWHSFLEPSSIWPRHVGHGGFSEIPVNIGFYLLSLVPAFSLRVFYYLFFDDSQRAEYRSDLLGASVAGTEGFIGLTRKGALDDIYFLAWQKSAISQESKGFFTEFSELLREVPEREFDRLERTYSLAASRLDLTHPPMGYRLKLLRESVFQKPRVILHPEREKEILAELSGLFREVERNLAEKYLDLMTSW